MFSGFYPPNLFFWDEWTGQYRGYTRGIAGNDPNVDFATVDLESVRRQRGREFFGGVRWIRHATSRDFRTWTPLQDIDTGGTPIRAPIYERVLGLRQGARNVPDVSVPVRGPQDARPRLVRRPRGQRHSLHVEPGRGPLRPKFHGGVHAAGAGQEELARAGHLLPARHLPDLPHRADDVRDRAHQDSRRPHKAVHAEARRVRVRKRRLRRAASLRPSPSYSRATNWS